jgi:hypothetical protein
MIMPGMGLLNEGYEPNSWNNESPKVKTATNFNGVGLDSGPIDLTVHPEEGFALLHCGGTAVKIGFSNMRQICALLASGSRAYGKSVENDKVLKAFFGVTCETSVGNQPITSSFSEHQLKVSEEKLARVQKAMDVLAEALKS